MNQYHTDLQELNGNGYTPEQNAHFKNLCDLVRENKMSMNEAYQNACGYKNADGEETEKPKGGFVGSFKLWVQNAVDNKWVEQGATIMTGIQDKFSPQAVEDKIAEIERQERNKKMIVNVGLVVGIVALTVTAIILIKKHKQEAK